jgi:hypothetical protein
MKALLAVLCLLYAVPVAAQDTAFRASMVAAIAAHGADLSSTEHCLGAGRCTELNPWLARFDQPAVFGAAKMAVAGLSLWGTAKLKDAGHPKLAIAANVGQAIGFSLIAWHNARVSR